MSKSIPTSNQQNNISAKDTSKGAILMEVKGITKTFGPVTALRNVNFHVCCGEIHGLIGENGSGKSTVTSIYSGMQKPDSGEMLYKGKPWHPTSMLDALAHGVGMIVQETGTVPGISVADNMFLGETKRFSKLGFVNYTAMVKEANRVLDEIGAKHIRGNMLTGDLDLQDRKLIEIAKVYMKKPELIVVDETTTVLSQQGREIVYHMMNKMKEDNKAVIFISHDLDEIMEVCNAITVLRDGDIIRTFKKEEFEPNAIRTSMIGREMQGDYYRGDWDGRYLEEVVLELKDANLGDRLKNFSLQLHKGEILGIGGLSHCGMHTLGKVLFGAQKLESGNVYVYGKNPVKDNLIWKVDKAVAVNGTEENLVQLMTAVATARAEKSTIYRACVKYGQKISTSKAYQLESYEQIWDTGVHATINGKDAFAGSLELLELECGITDIGKVNLKRPEFEDALHLFYDGKYIGHYLMSHEKPLPKREEEVKDEAFAMSRKIGYVSKDRDIESLCLSASIKDNITIAGMDQFDTCNGLFVSWGAENAYADKQVFDLKIKCFDKSQEVSQLSGGNKQKVVFGKWIGRESEILILDCPTRGIDVGVKQSMYQLMYRLKKEGKSIIMISEELPELMGMSDRIVIMKDGAITGEFNRDKELSDAMIIGYMI